jgi:hypothetical protein
MPSGPFSHEPVGFEIDEAGTVGEFTDQRIVDARELLAGVVRVRGRRAEVCICAEVPVKGVEEETVVVLAGGDCRFVKRPRVQSDPRTVSDALDTVGDDEVGVQLRIPGARFPVVEGSRHRSASTDVGDAVPAGSCVDD